MRAHQPGSEPMDIPEVIPNPAVLPKEAPDPNKPAPAKPVEKPERFPQTTNRLRSKAVTGIVVTSASDSTFLISPVSRSFLRLRGRAQGGSVDHFAEAHLLLGNSGRLALNEFLL